MTLARTQSAKLSRRTQRSVSLAALLLTGTALSCMPTAAQAQSTWNGATSKDWFDPTNWAPNAVPATTDDTIIDTTAPNTTRVDGGNAGTDALTVGLSGTGNLTILDAAVLDSDSGVVGDQGGSNGAVSVQGPNTQWFLNNNGLTIGNAGTGSMIVDGGAKVTDGFASIGASGVGNVTVDGANSTWETNGDMFVGGGSIPGGQGTLLVKNGGLVIAGDTAIGVGGNSTGIVTIEGAGSGLSTSNGSVVVGLYGNGTLNIKQGGVVQALSAYVGALTLDPTHVGSGTVEMDDAGSTFYVTNGIYVGGSDNGDPASGTSGKLLINSGALLNSTGDFIVGSSAGSTGDVEIAGAGSTLVHDGDLTIGDFDGTGTVKFLEQGQGSIKDDILLGGTAQSIGTLLVDGAQTKLGGSDLTVGYDGTGTATVSGGGELDASSLVIANDTGSTGTVTVTGAGSILLDTADAVIGNSGTGTLNIQAGGKMTDINAYIGSDTGAGTATVDGMGSSWTTQSNLTVADHGAGTLTISNGGLVGGASIVVGVNAGVTGQAQGNRCGVTIDREYNSCRSFRIWRTISPRWRVGQG
jgi:fibronectin-binding autotransporter adhesin